jgi:hypothetical protein
VAEVELHADEEEQQYQADLGQHLEDSAEQQVRHLRRQARDRWVEYSGEQSREQPPEHGRPQDQSGRDLADHGRLADAAEQPGENAGRSDDQGQLDQQPQEKGFDGDFLQRLQSLVRRSSEHALLGVMKVREIDVMRPVYGKGKE